MAIQPFAEDMSAPTAGQLPPTSTREPHPRQRRPGAAPTTFRRAGASKTGSRPAEPDDGVREDVCEVACVDQDAVHQARRALPPAATVHGLADTLRALGDPTRLQIIVALAAEGVRELCVCDLARLVGVSESAVSHSLRTLRHLRLVRYRKAGKIAYYALDDAHVARFVAEGLQHVAAARRHSPDAPAV